MKCPECAADIDPNLDRCLLCATDVGAPNCRAAGAVEEQVALRARYMAALADARSRGCERVVREFEATVASSKAVMARSANEVLYAIERRLIPTYQAQVAGGTRKPDLDEWASRRPSAEGVLFAGYENKIHYAALSLNGKAPHRWGAISLTFGEKFIAKRVSLLEENVVFFVEKHGRGIPPGHRSTWAERAALCVAKLSSKLDRNFSPKSFPELLLDPSGSASADFVEVHIYDTVVIESAECVHIAKCAEGMFQETQLEFFRVNGIEVIFESGAR